MQPARAAGRQTRSSSCCRRSRTHGRLLAIASQRPIRRKHKRASPAMAMMKAAVMYEAGGPEVLKVESRPIPKPQKGQVLIRVKAFGLNRSELFTRQGHSPSVKLPRVLGIEAAGLVEDAP